MTRPERPRQTKPPLPEGLRHLPGYFDAQAQADLVAAVFQRLAAAPLYTPRLARTGTPMRVEMTNFGPLGWVTDQAGGYRYQTYHPVTGEAWPDMPDALTALWGAVSGAPAPAQACLVNLYREGSRLGLHVDADEAARDVAVVSVSLGDPALFRIGGPARHDPTRSFWLHSGDVVVLGGAARNCHHGVDRIRHGERDLVAGGGRLNLTLRRVSPPERGSPGRSNLQVS